MKPSLCLALFAAALAAQQPQTFFTLADADRDGSITREELRAAIAKWPAGAAEQLAPALDAAFPQASPGTMLPPRSPQNQTPRAGDVEKMMAALPSSAPAKPKRPHKVLVLCKCAGFIHSCIPLAAKTIQELGAKTGVFTATVTYDPAEINAQNLKQYDLVFLNNTTGEFLNDPDANVTAARKKALLDFVRSGKGLAGVHAASDSYHRAALAPQVVAAADTDGDKKVTTEELSRFSDRIFDRLDAGKTGKLSVDLLRTRFLNALNGPATPGRGRPGPDFQDGTWLDFNKMIGGFFKYHWLDPQHIDYKIDDDASPLTAMFRPNGFSVNDETYTFGVRVWTRRNLHVLTSIDYARMSEADRLKEDYPREDHDYGLSWIRREGKGRVFYAAHGHNERVYMIKPFLEHMLAGIQYALGDLKANDKTSAR